MSELLTLKVEPSVHQAIVDESHRRRKRKEPNHRIFEVAREAISTGIQALKQKRKLTK